MRRRLTIAAALIATGTTLFWSDPAEADPVPGGGHKGDHDGFFYRNMLVEYGATDLNVGEAMHIGQAICQQLAAGVPEGRVVITGADDRLPSDSVRVAVFGAEYHFCPAYY